MFDHHKRNSKAKESFLVTLLEELADKLQCGTYIIYFQIPHDSVSFSCSALYKSPISVVKMDIRTTHTRTHTHVRSRKHRERRGGGGGGAERDQTSTVQVQCLLSFHIKI